MTRSAALYRIVGAALVLAGGCTNTRSSGRRGPADDGGTSDPSCWDPSSIVPGITCGTARPEVACPGSCAQTLDGIVGVGLSTCRCMDTGSGLGAQWICDTSGCESGADGAVPSDGGARSDAGGACAPYRFAAPAAPGCTLEQRAEIARIESDLDFYDFLAAPANAECVDCLTASVLACGTSMGCDDEGGALQCCLEATCGADETCRQSALRGACDSTTMALTSCVSALSACNLDPLAPPAECFP